MAGIYVTKFRESDGQPDVMGFDAPMPRRRLSVDVKEMTAKGLWAADVRDRQGDVVPHDIFDLAGYELNPVVLVDHGKWHALSIGRCGPPGGAPAIETGDGEAWQKTWFSQSSRIAEDVFRLIEEDMLRGNSAGFRPKTWESLPDDPAEGFRSSRDKPAGKLVTSAELVEISWCAVPVNQEAARVIVGKSWGGRPLAPALLEQFRPWLPDRRSLPVAGGWDGGQDKQDSARNPDSGDSPAGEKAWAYADALDAPEREAAWLAAKAWSYGEGGADWLAEKARTLRQEGEVWTVGGNRYTKVGGKIRRAPLGGKGSPKQTPGEYEQWKKRQAERYQGPARPKGDPAKAREAVLAHIAKGQAATADDVHALANTLRGLTRDEIRAIKSEHGVKASGLKWDLAAKVADRLIEAVRARAQAEKPPEEPKEGPKEEPPKEPARAAPAQAARAMVEKNGAIKTDDIEEMLGDREAAVALVKEMIGEGLIRRRVGWIPGDFVLVPPEDREFEKRYQMRKKADAEKAAREKEAAEAEAGRKAEQGDGEPAARAAPGALPTFTSRAEQGGRLDYRTHKDGRTVTVSGKGTEWIEGDLEAAGFKKDRRTGEWTGPLAGVHSWDTVAHGALTEPFTGEDAPHRGWSKPMAKKPPAPPPAPAAPSAPDEARTPPREGLVFDEASHRWVRPEEQEGAKEEPKPEEAKPAEPAKEEVSPSGKAEFVARPHQWSIDKLPPMGPDMNVIEGEIAGLPITTTDRGLIGKVSKNTKGKLEEALGDPDIVQALKDAGIKHLQLTTHKGPGKYEGGWTMAHAGGALLFHSQTGERIDRSPVKERREGGIKRIIHHEAGHGLWDKAGEGERKAFVDALARNPQVLAEIGKIVNIAPPRDSWDHDAKERAATEVHSELNAMRRYDPERYAGMPEEIRRAADAISGKPAAPAPSAPAEARTPPREGLVFDEASHRWVRPEEQEGAKEEPKPEEPARPAVPAAASGVAARAKKLFDDSLDLAPEEVAAGLDELEGASAADLAQALRALGIERKPKSKADSVKWIRELVDQRRNSYYRAAQASEDPATRQAASERLAGKGGKRPAEAKPVHDDPDVQAAFGDAYRRLSAAASRVGGVVKIPELVDAMQEAVPGLAAEQAHAALRRWAKDGKLTLQKLNLPMEEARAGEGIRAEGSPELFYVDAGDGAAFPSRQGAAQGGGGPPPPPAPPPAPAATMAAKGGGGVAKADSLGRGSPLPPTAASAIRAATESAAPVLSHLEARYGRDSRDLADVRAWLGRLESSPETAGGRAAHLAWAALARMADKYTTMKMPPELRPALESLRRAMEAAKGDL